MLLTLRIRTHLDRSADDEREKSFDRFPVLVGRGASCDYVLDDASKYISANHATIERDGDALVILDTSANGVYLNGAPSPVGRGNRAPLADRDLLCLGDYTLSVGIGVAGADDRASDLAGLDPFSATSTGQDFDWALDATPANAPARPADPDATDGFDGPDPWSDPAPPPARPLGVVPGPVTETGWADWDVDAAPSPTPPPGGVPAPSPAPGRSRGAPAGRPSVHDASTVASSGAGTPPPRRSARSVPAGRARPPTRSPSPARPPAAPAMSDEVLNAAGVDTASLAVRDPAGLPRELGTLLARALDGIMSLLRSRGDIKRALHTDETRLERAGNNPLKFEPDAAGALRRLLEDDGRGAWLDAERAIGEAVDELEQHQLAVLDAMKAAVRTTLEDLSPEALEELLGPGRSRATGLIGGRDARSWQAYRERWPTLRAEALGRFGERFGEAFDAALAERARGARRSDG